MKVYLIYDHPSSLLANALQAYLSPLFSKSCEFTLCANRETARENWTWDELFDVSYKEQSLGNKEAKESYFIFLFQGKNEGNWFASFDHHRPSLGFVQTSGWELYQLSNPLYAIAYHLLTLLTAMKFFGNEESPNTFYHGKSIGCMFDFTGFKSEVIYKLQSAYICKDCLESIKQRAPEKVEALNYLQGVTDAFLSIRHNLFQVDLKSLFGNLAYKLHVNERMTFGLEIEGKWINLPISKGREATLYMLLLHNQRGLRYIDFKKEAVLEDYLSLYFRYFVSKGSYEELYRQAKQQIKDHTFRKSLEPLISRMRKKLAEALLNYPEIKEQLYIQNQDGLMYIPLNRKFLVHNIQIKQRMVG
ncbi:hypothetical protein Belba_1101 [Belliella baltica DSM 15883]|uniref:Uncharacterized protein n=1 Tax=Belliella baltica (strain DSM 15883 / CIP 108006 / LMG 21964 / BA134) TaxID=866536 RepID=I3Z3C0_BELBD|nr:hypothetical protein [Belliella baltica]AFL83738.1 hypothetical protein Belba_1101 [Belliella baltica DSM 15883]